MSISNKLLMAANTESPFFSQILYTGDGTNFREFNMGHPSALVANRMRNPGGTQSWCVNDVVRGDGLPLRFNKQQVETSSNNTIREFTSTGFKTGTSSLVNQSPYNYVAYSFSTGGASTVTNTDGSLTSSVNASVDNGFSICTYTGNGTNGSSFGHGLEQTPDLVLVKRRDAQGNWWARGAVLATGKYLQLDLTINQFSSTFIGLSSTVVEVNSDPDQNTSGGTYVAYCFHSVTGKSKIATYTGNGSTNGPAISLGFRPAFVMIKRVESSGPWVVLDSIRDTVNPRTVALNMNDDDPEYTLSGGVNFGDSTFTIKTNNADLNANTGTYLYFAIAEES